MIDPCFICIAKEYIGDRTPYVCKYPFGCSYVSYSEAGVADLMYYFLS